MTRLLGHADHHGAAARQFLLGDFGHELQIDPQALAFLPGRVVKEINHVFDPSAGFQVERIAAGLLWRISGRTPASITQFDERRLGAEKGVGRAGAASLRRINIPDKE